MKYFLSFTLFLFYTSLSFGKPFLATEERKLVLLEFSVTQSGSKTDIKWSMNVPPVGNFFTIEKSSDGKIFTKIIDMPVSERGNLYEEYFESDYQPLKGVSYYRIKQTDSEGNTWYSDMTAFKYNPGQATRIYSSIPTDDSGLDSEISSTVGKETLFVLRDADGADYYSKLNLGLEDNHLVALDEPAKMAPGIYRIVGSSSNRLYSLKLVVK